MQNNVNTTLKTCYLSTVINLFALRIIANCDKNVQHKNHNASVETRFYRYCLITIVKNRLEKNLTTPD